MLEPEKMIWTPRAWLTDTATRGWRSDVLLKINGRGEWASIESNTPREAAAARGAQCLNEALLPSPVNTHSHAFQRAFAGLSERRVGDRDDFWSWRDRMYQVALAISPEQLKSIASQLYVELLRGGYTHVCEFHYVHHDVDGSPFHHPFAMTDALIDAACEVGIGLTVLPVLYERAGFAAPALRDDQRRFATNVEFVISLQDYVNARGIANETPLNAGVAIHSLRAAKPDSIRSLAERVRGPIHIHVAEQTGEVDDCLASTGLRPVEWLAAQGLLDPRWHLVHATHVTQQEIHAVSKAGAGVVLCPTTEANLGDGLTDVAAWFDAGVASSIGSDSHVNRDWREELRLLEYGQRLQRRQRNVIAAPQQFDGSTAARAFSIAVDAGAAAAGLPGWGLRVGARADALCVNHHQAALFGVPDRHTLDALVFSSPAAPFDAVMVAGRWVLGANDDASRAGVVSGQANSIERDFAAAMRRLHRSN